MSKPSAPTPAPPAPPPQPVRGLSAPQKAALATARENSASGIPAVVLAAVVPKTAAVHGIVFQPFYPRVFAILRDIKSVVVGATMDGLAPDEQIDNVMRSLYVMTAPIAEVKMQVAQGIEHLTTRAYDALGERFEVKDLPDIIQAMLAHIAGGFSTVPGGKDAAEKKAPVAAPAADGSSV